MKTSNLRTELQPFENKDPQNMTMHQRYDHLVISYKLIALTPNFNVNVLKNQYLQYLRDEDIREITANVKLYQKYIIMKDKGIDWKTTYNFFVQTIDNILGISAIEKQFCIELDILKDLKKN